MNVRTVARLAVTNAASAVYLGVVGISIAIATAVTLFSPDPGFIWVWPAFLTAPVSLLTLGAGMALWGVEGAPAWFLVGGVVVSALVQSLALGALYLGLRGDRGARRHRPQHG
ncbi:SCO4225 family membrane protein [Streptomyces sp. NPDC050504]|uniref:SCO4225 family membrane protein n=1 Tax=Streptomyces sp. NPDC050504 TaxID=3365618 RepID=UPI0037A11736